MRRVVTDAGGGVAVLDAHGVVIAEESRVAVPLLTARVSGLSAAGVAAREGLARQWASVVGSREALLMMLREAINDVAPDEILTMDPRHGTTCQTAHRAIAQLTLEVVLDMPAPPTMRFSASVFGGDGATFIGLVAVRQGALREAAGLPPELA